MQYLRRFFVTRSSTRLSPCGSGTYGPNPTFSGGLQAGRDSLSRFQIGPAKAVGGSETGYVVQLRTRQEGWKAFNRKSSGKRAVQCAISFRFRCLPLAAQGNHGSEVTRAEQRKEDVRRDHGALPDWSNRQVDDSHFGSSTPPLPRFCTEPRVWCSPAAKSGPAGGSNGRRSAPDHHATGRVAAGPSKRSLISISDDHPWAGARRPCTGARRAAA